MSGTKTQKKEAAISWLAGFGTEAFFLVFSSLLNGSDWLKLVRWDSFFTFFGTEALKAKNCVHGYSRILGFVWQTQPDLASWGTRICSNLFFEGRECAEIKLLYRTPSCPGCITNKTSYLAPLPGDDILLEMTFCTGNLSWFIVILQLYEVLIVFSGLGSRFPF